MVKGGNAGYQGWGESTGKEGKAKSETGPLLRAEHAPPNRELATWNWAPYNCTVLPPPELKPGLGLCPLYLHGPSTGQLGQRQAEPP